MAFAMPSAVPTAVTHGEGFGAVAEKWQKQGAPAHVPCVNYSNAKRGPGRDASWSFPFPLSPKGAPKEA